MAWKFDNPWGGGNAQNLWDIQGEEAQKAFTTDTTKAEDDNPVSNPENTPFGWTVYEGIDDVKICLPNKGVERVKNPEKKLIRFNFGNNIIYEAKYDDTKKILGYYQEENKYENPSVIYNNTTYGHNSMEARPTHIDGMGVFIDFKVNNLRVEDIAIVQILITTGIYPTSFNKEQVPNIPQATFETLRSLILLQNPTIYEEMDSALFVKNSYRFTENNILHEGIVDGGPYSSLGLFDSPMYLDKPYINISLIMGNDFDEVELKSWEKGANELFNGYLHHEDGPNIQQTTVETKFITLLIGKNYMKSGKDIILYSIKWGYIKEVNKTAAFVKETYNDLTENDITQIIAIINHDFPNTNYTFFGY